RRSALPSWSHRRSRAHSRRRNHLLGSSRATPDVNGARRLAGGLFLVGALAAAPRAVAQSSGSGGASSPISAYAVRDYPHGKEAFFELSIEPKTQVSEGDTWRSLEVTPLVEYYPLHWLDLEGEMHFARTRQSEGTDSWEVTPRIGFRTNIFSN